MKHLFMPSLASAFCVLANTVAFGASVTPTYDTFGSLPSATFGGSGIPNHAVAQTTYDGVTIALTAHQRYVGPNLANNGAGRFYAPAGPGSPASYALWNFGMYVNALTTGYSVELLYDFDPGAGTDQSVLGKVMFGPVSGLSQDSWNDGMAFLSVLTPPFVTPPTYPSFDPNAVGEYSFALILRNSLGAEVARSAINVETSRVPDGGSTLALLSFSVVMLGTMLRRQQA